MLLPTLSKHCVCTINIFVINDHGKQILKFENKIDYSVKFPVPVLTIKYFISTCRWVI